MASVTSVDDETPYSGDVYLIDTSVWLLLFATSMSDFSSRMAAKYADFITHAKTKGSKLLVIPDVIGEYTNRRIKNAMNDHPAGQVRANAKVRRDGFRASPEWKPLISEITSEVEGILGLVEVGPSPVRDANTLQEMLRDLRTQPLDWTDLAIAHAAMKSKAVIVTNDGDFGESDLEISVVTALRG